MAKINAVTTSGAILGAILVKLRTEKEMNQGDLASAVGMSPSTWSRIEKGDSGLSIDQLRQASKALGVTPGLILEMMDAAEQAVKDQGVRIDPSKIASSAITPTMQGAAAGAAMGIVLPVVGTALGAIIGGTIAHFLQSREIDKE